MNHEAIYRAYPNTVRISDSLGAFDADGNQIELDQTLVDAAAAEIAAELAATEYQRQRAPEYPSLATLADALYWNSTGDSTKLDEYYAACAAVKAKYPKGGDS
jgi:streptomycin 6-kinase